MSPGRQLDRERLRARLTSLSVAGATLAGVGFGIVFAEPFDALAWPLLAAGILVHVIGMAGLRSLLSATGYRPAKWETFAFWLCWAVIAAIAAYACWLWLGGAA